ncbi:RagB/SusD family nutrient uptake outer membrane protein [Terrimonas sp.]|uniref:RagB/SusD family nutrient uptake outer membrane protein n=1 Tax=Terrimonas sp. TaxID=1914338 RepID=UPI000D511C76|nr:RagB/SusD family nutrient uptake outer membrane protein [Terrimonas sp.]PVD50791.1 RagB/SusD family nutrient uptake outer membrane protein [Terrimonas sp.]
MQFRNISTYTAVVFLILLSSGCKKFLDQVPDDRVTIEEVFQKKQASEEYLANVYSHIREQGNQWTVNPFSGNTDELDVTWAKYSTYQLNIGSWNPTSLPFDIWGEQYKGIRSATYFINHIDGNEEILRLNGQQRIDQYKAEARFVRAYCYFALLRQYGPIVILGNEELAPDAPTADFQIPRSSYDESVEYIAGQLDSVAAVLPTSPAEDRDYGRATKGAALALKARILLYAASPAFNGNADYANFKNQDGKSLISGAYDTEKWKRAADANKAVIDLNLYALYKHASGDPVESYRGILLDAYNGENIFSRRNNNLTDWDVHSMPRAAGGWCGMGATQEMVDAYFMKDGLPITESSLYSENGFTDDIYNMYVNREPRFYASVNYHNRMIQGGNIITARRLNFFNGGTDGRYEGTEDYSKTGYLVWKNVSPNTNRITGQWYNRPNVLIRLGEIYLNYAEALNEYDYNSNQTEILKYINLIRERAGIPQYGTGPDALPIPATQSEMRDKIRQERRIELAFESHRWFDMRRWKIARDVMKPVHGMNCNGKDASAFFVRTEVTPRQWRDAYMFYPLPQYEIDRGRLLVQNPGW